MRKLSEIYKSIDRIKDIDDPELLDIYEKNAEKELAEATATIEALDELLAEIKKRKRELN
jgi:ABC-type Zn uptake system ZnuABC Zn-binding protein ZnuA